MLFQPFILGWQYEGKVSRLALYIPEWGALLARVRAHFLDGINNLVTAAEMRVTPRWHLHCTDCTASMNLS